MSKNDAAYFHARAKVEREQARRATCPEAAKAHDELVQIYLERAKSASAEGLSEDD